MIDHRFWSIDHPPVGEVADLTLADVRNRDGSIKSEIYLASHRVKHGYARTVYVSTRLQAELAAYVGSRTWHEPTQPLFYTHRGPRRGFSANTLSQHFFWLYRRAGISNASSHSGRKTFLTSLCVAGHQRVRAGKPRGAQIHPHHSEIHHRE